MSRAPNEPAVFAQRWYLRAMNIIAASVGATFFLGIALDRPSPRPVLIALAGVAAAACMLFGVRGMLSQVVVTSDSVRYRGIVGTRTIPLSQLLGFQRDRSWLALLAGDVPSLLWRHEDGTVATTTLWCFVISRQARIGRGSTYEVREALRLALDPYIQRNL
ncbi:PH domain-containing protein [Actinomadura opuntiae]|uniref:PH domain-containing protein n=1 Tax=Actinomadura sp. OS1-43 TaxID=604315 RepID=UPI00255AE044|nr:PH domain-containing protein [Actinomadura sp. OS1-43]MDL4812671.1 PH domain-containing protein [Actinomadura sp. OS1-43]